MAQNQAVGRSSIIFANPVIIKTSGSVVGQMEAQGPLGSYFDIKGQDKDDLFGADTWEKAESALQKQAIDVTLQKAELKAERHPLFICRRSVGTEYCKFLWRYGF